MPVIEKCQITTKIIATKRSNAFTMEHAVTGGYCLFLLDTLGHLEGRRFCAGLSSAGIVLLGNSWDLT